MREPSAQLVSMYNHCQAEGGSGQAKNHYARVGLSEWLRRWLAAPLALGDARALLGTCGFIPLNAQTACLSSESCSGDQNAGLFKVTSRSAVEMAWCGGLNRPPLDLALGGLPSIGPSRPPLNHPRIRCRSDH